MKRKRLTNIDRIKEEIKKEARIKGGKAKSPEKKFAALINASKKALCRRCNVQCEIKKQMISMNSEAICIIPTTRAIAIRDNIIISIKNPSILEYHINDLINFYWHRYIAEPSQENAEELFDKFIKFKEAFYPSKKENAQIIIGGK